MAGTSGREEWFRHGRLHRSDGPAVIHANGSVKYYVDGVRHRRAGRPASTSTGPRSGIAKASAIVTVARRRPTQTAVAFGSSKARRCVKSAGPAGPRWSKRC